MSKILFLTELNIKELTFDNNFENWVKYDCKPDYSTLDSKLANEIGKFGNTLSNLNQEDIEDLINKKYIEFKNEKINSSDIDVRLIKNKDNPNQEIVNDFSVYLDIELNEDLVLEEISKRACFCNSETREKTWVLILPTEYLL